MAAAPTPSIPQHPVLSLATFAGRRRAAYRCVLDCGRPTFVTSGRMAIALALKHIGVGADDKVLVPAFHCSSMIEPVLWAGAQPVLYRIGDDAQADLADAMSKIDPAVKAMILTHYFGFPQQAPRARALCDEAKIALIEDCAHAYFGDFSGRPPGWYGDYAIASIMKFLPVYDGGCLVSSRRDLDGIETVEADPWFQVKALLNAFEQAFVHGRLPLLGALLAIPLRLKDALWRAVKSGAAGGGRRAPAASSGGSEFDPVWVDKQMTRGSRWIMRLASADRIAESRRRNYALLSRGLDGLPGATRLFGDLPEGVVPYVFPLLVEDARQAAAELRRAGVPLLRWEDFAVSVAPGAFPNSESLYRRLLQIPCHEGLSPAELEWMIDRIRRVLAPRPPVPDQPDPALPASCRVAEGGRRR